MSAKFWWDRVGSSEKSANGDPDLVYQGLEGSFDGEATDDLRKLWKGGDKTSGGMIIPKGYALVMGGTTAELQKALMVAQQNISYCVIFEPMVIRYFRKQVRRLTDVHTDTVLSIAGLNSYWRQREVKGWKDLAWHRETNLAYIPLSWLIDMALPACKDGKIVGPLAPDAQQFKYRLLSGANREGTIFTLTPISGFYVMRTYDTDVSTPDQSKWRYTGDKVHVSVQWERVPDAWDLMLLILLAHPDTIKEFKVTNMEEIGRKLDNETARRIYYGAQISVYLRVAPGDEADAAGRFARVMMTVSPIMRDAGIKPGQQPGSDLTVNPYVSFRHDYDDLIDPEKFNALKQKAKAGFLSEEFFYGYPGVTISDSDPRYAKHRELMESRPLYRAMRAMQLPPLPPIPR